RHDEAVEVIRSAFEAWRHGDPKRPENLQGPQISRLQQERVLDFIERGKREGARCLVGGGRPEGKGFFVEPTLFTDVEPKMTIAQEEIFGPVLCVIPYSDEEEAIRIANDSPYGLSGGIHSGDEERALRVARRIRTGTLSVNGGQWFHVDTPFGGYKQSGVGRENGVMGFEELLETKVIALPGSER
ncbi:MAG TPA: aldehyde dehydrogenase family protein, partial [Myxococcota bacterium]|nr:aldehyde dehydrogenase family protein [Myxococcota bacterium]